MTYTPQASPHPGSSRNGSGIGDIQQIEYNNINSATAHFPIARSSTPVDYPNAYCDPDPLPITASNAQRVTYAEEARAMGQRTLEAYRDMGLAGEDLWLEFITLFRPHTIEAWDESLLARWVYFFEEKNVYFDDATELRDVDKLIQILYRKVYNHSDMLDAYSNLTFTHVAYSTLSSSSDATTTRSDEGDPDWHQSARDKETYAQPMSLVEIEELAPYNPAVVSLLEPSPSPSSTKMPTPSAEGPRIQRSAAINPPNAANYYYTLESRQRAPAVVKGRNVDYFEQPPLHDVQVEVHGFDTVADLHVTVDRGSNDRRLDGNGHHMIQIERDAGPDLRTDCKVTSQIAPSKNGEEYLCAVSSVPFQEEHRTASVTSHGDNLHAVEPNVHENERGEGNEGKILGYQSGLRPEPPDARQVEIQAHASQLHIGYEDSGIGYGAEALVCESQSQWCTVQGRQGDVSQDPFYTPQLHYLEDTLSDTLDPRSLFQLWTVRAPIANATLHFSSKTDLNPPKDSSSEFPPQCINPPHDPFSLTQPLRPFVHDEYLTSRHNTTEHPDGRCDTIVDANFLRTPLVPSIITEWPPAPTLQLTIRPVSGQEHQNATFTDRLHSGSCISFGKSRTANDEDEHSSIAPDTPSTIDLVGQHATSQENGEAVHRKAAHHAIDASAYVKYSQYIAPTRTAPHTTIIEALHTISLRDVGGVYRDIVYYNANAAIYDATLDLSKRRLVGGERSTLDAFESQLPDDGPEMSDACDSVVVRLTVIIEEMEEAPTVLVGMRHRDGIHALEAQYRSEPLINVRVEDRPRRDEARLIITLDITDKEHTDKASLLNVCENMQSLVSGCDERDPGGPKANTMCSIMPNGERAVDARLQSRRLGPKKSSHKGCATISTSGRHPVRKERRKMAAGAAAFKCDEGEALEMSWNDHKSVLVHTEIDKTNCKNDSQGHPSVVIEKTPVVMGGFSDLVQVEHHESRDVTMSAAEQAPPSAVVLALSGPCGKEVIHIMPPPYVEDNQGFRPSASESEILYPMPQARQQQQIQQGNHFLYWQWTVSHTYYLAIILLLVSMPARRTKRFDVVQIVSTAPATVDLLHAITPCSLLLGIVPRTHYQAATHLNTLKPNRLFHPSKRTKRRNFQSNNQRTTHCNISHPNHLRDNRNAVRRRDDRAYQHAAPISDVPKHEFIPHCIRSHQRTGEGYGLRDSGAEEVNSAGEKLDGDAVRGDTRKERLVGDTAAALDVHGRLIGSAIIDNLTQYNWNDLKYNLNSSTTYQVRLKDEAGTSMWMKTSYHNQDQVVMEDSIREKERRKTLRTVVKDTPQTVSLRTGEYTPRKIDAVRLHANVPADGEPVHRKAAHHTVHGASYGEYPKHIASQLTAPFTRKQHSHADTRDCYFHINSKHSGKFDDHAKVYSADVDCNADNDAGGEKELHAHRTHDIDEPQDWLQRKYDRKTGAASYAVVDGGVTATNNMKERLTGGSTVSRKFKEITFFGVTKGDWPREQFNGRARDEDEDKLDSNKESDKAKASNGSLIYVVLEKEQDSHTSTCAARKQLHLDYQLLVSTAIRREIHGNTEQARATPTQANRKEEVVDETNKFAPQESSLELESSAAHGRRRREEEAQMAAELVIPSRRMIKRRDEDDEHKITTVREGEEEGYSKGIGWFVSHEKKILRVSNIID